MRVSEAKGWTWTSRVLRNLGKFIGKHLRQSLFLNKVADLRPATLLKRRLWRRCFLVNFAKFLRTPFFTEHLRWLLLALHFTIALMTDSLIFSDVRSIWSNCGMLKLVTILEKNSFKTLAVSLSLFLSLSTIVIFSFEIIFDDNGLNAFQNILLSQTFFSLSY